MAPCYRTTKHKQTARSNKEIRYKQ